MKTKVSYGNIALFIGGIRDPGSPFIDNFVSVGYFHCLKIITQDFLGTVLTK